LQNIDHSGQNLTWIYVRKYGIKF